MNHSSHSTADQMNRYQVAIVAQTHTISCGSVWRQSFSWRNTGDIILPIFLADLSKKEPRMKTLEKPNMLLYGSSHERHEYSAPLLFDTVVSEVRWHRKEEKTKP